MKYEPLSNKRIKIVQFMASEKWGGAEKVFVEISNELAVKHHVVVLLLRNTEYLNRFSHNVEIIELVSHPTRHNPFLLLEIYLKLKKIKPDIIHTHAAKASSLLKRVSYFININHLATKHNARKGRIFNRLPWISVVSEEAKRSVKPKKGAMVRVINNGINPKKIVAVKKRKAFSIAAIGRLDNIKGFDILIDEVKHLPFPFHLSIVGNGDEYDRLFHKIERLGLQKKVSLRGFQEDIPGIMGASDLIVMSSHSEGFPKVMVEALFYGNVLISTPVGGVVEVLPPEFLVKHTGLANKIIEVKANYNYFSSQFEALKKNKSNDYILSKIVDKYESIYQEMLKKVLKDEEKSTGE